jgi:outer membrane lipoprotein-sorting protein
MPTEEVSLRAKTGAALLLLPFLIPAGAVRADAPRLDRMTAPELTDFQATVKVVKADQTELGKINRDFGMAYRLKSLTMRYKEPGKLRMDGAIGKLVVNGASRFFQVPQLNFKKRDSLGESPGNRYSLLDVGLLTPSSLAGMQSKFLREEDLEGTATDVFDLAYKGDESSRYVVWVDPKTRTIVKREWLDGAGKRKATFRYLEPKEVKPGLWVPTRIEIRNSEDIVAGITAYSDVKVNQGLEDSLFEIS